MPFAYLLLQRSAAHTDTASLRYSCYMTCGYTNTLTTHLVFLSFFHGLLCFWQPQRDIFSSGGRLSKMSVQLMYQNTVGALKLFQQRFFGPEPFPSHMLSCGVCVAHRANRWPLAGFED